VVAHASRAGSPATSPSLRLLVPVLFAALVAATLLTFAIVEHERDLPRFVDNVTVTPQFDPTGANGLPRESKLVFRLTRDEAAADVLVVDSGGEPVRTLASDRFLGDYALHEFEWDGSRDGGDPAPPGTYRFRIVLGDLGREITPPDRTHLVPAPASQPDSA
jgi:hypothetical protein